MGSLDDQHLALACGGQITHPARFSGFMEPIDSRGANLLEPVTTRFFDCLNRSMIDYRAGPGSIVVCLDEAGRG